MIGRLLKTYVLAATIAGSVTVWAGQDGTNRTPASRETCSKDVVGKTVNSIKDTVSRAMEVNSPAACALQLTYDLVHANNDFAFLEMCVGMVPPMVMQSLRFNLTAAGDVHLKLCQ